MKKEREPIEAVLFKKQLHSGSADSVYGQPGHADYYMAQYMYCDGNRDKKYTCFCLGVPPQSIYLEGGLRKRPLGEFGNRVTTNPRGFVAYRGSDAVSARMIGFLFVPGLVAALFMFVLFVMKLLGT